MIKRILLTILSIGIIAFVAISIWAINIFGGFDKTYKGEELTSYYSENQIQISELINHFDSIVPKDKEIEIAFESDTELFRFGVTSIDITRKARFPMYLEWNLNIEEDIPEKILNEINWDRQTFASLKSKLDKAGCIQIESGNPKKIGFQRSGMGMYSYYIYDNTSSNEFLNQQKTRDDIHFFKNNIAWKYDGGALD